MENLSYLSKTYACGEILSSEDLNLLVAFINGIIDYINNTVNTLLELGGTPGQDGRDGRDGTNGTNGRDGDTPEVEIREVGGKYYWFINGTNTYVLASYENGFDYKLEKDLTFINLKNEVYRLLSKIQELERNQGGSTTYDLTKIVNTILLELNTWNWGEIIGHAGYDELLQLYLINIGLITLDNFEGGPTLTTMLLSRILARLTSVETRVDNINLITDENGNLVNLTSLTAAIVAKLEEDYGYAGLRAALTDWPANGPTVFSAVSETKNTVEKTEAGLEALYSLYAGVISLDAYTSSLIEGIANELMARSTMSSVFGEYVTANDGLPVYDTWDDGINNGDGSPVYETDAYGRAIPYTGIVLRYIKYIDENNLKTNDPDKAVSTVIVTNPNDASLAVKKVAKTNNDGSVKKDNNGNVEYDLVVLKDNQGNDLRKQQAFKVYYRSNVIDSLYNSNNPPNPRTFSYGRYGLFAGNEYFYFEENFNNLFTSENGQAYDYSLHPLYMSNLQRYDSTDEINNPTVPYIKEGEIKWGTSTSGDYNDGHYDSNGLFIGVVFIKNYGPDKIAYHKVRKMKIKSSSGIITTANMDSAFATVFAQQGLMYSAIVNMTTNNAAFVSAVASAAVNLTETALATAKMIADSSMYLARTLYKYISGYDTDNNPIYSWYDIATAEEEFLGDSNNFSGTFSIDSSTLYRNYSNTAEKDLNNNIITRIKPGATEGEVEWVQDTTYVYNGEMHTFEQFKKDKINGVSMDTLSRKKLWIRDSDGVIIKEGDIDEATNKTYTENSYSSNLGYTEILITTIATPKKKLITQAQSGIINTVNLSEGSAMANLYARIEDEFDTKYAMVNAVVGRKLDNNGNPILRSKLENGTTYYAYRNISGSSVLGILTGDYGWLTSNWATLQPSYEHLLEPIYELESNLLIFADNIEIEGIISKLTADLAFIGNLTANKVHVKSYDDSGSPVIEYNIVLNAEDGYHNYYREGTMSNNVFTASNNTIHSINHISTDGTVSLGGGNIYCYESNGSFHSIFSGDIKITLYEFNSLSSSLYTLHIDPTSGITWLVNDHIPIINLNLDGSGIIARGNIEWNRYGDTTFRGIVEAVDIENTTNRYETIIKPNFGFYLAKATRTAGSNDWTYTTYSTANNERYINILRTNGSGYLAKGNISWDTEGDTTIKGSIEATLFRVLNGSNTAVEITYYLPNGIHSSLTGLVGSGLLEGEPVALVYDSNNHPIYFFDFAPVINFEAKAETIYRITGNATGASSGKVDLLLGNTIYLITDPNDSRSGKYIDSPKSTASLINNFTAFEFSESYNIITRTSIGLLTYYLYELSIYKEISISNGIKTYTGRYYMIKVDPRITGVNLQSYKPDGTTENVNVNNILNFTSSNWNSNTLLLIAVSSPAQNGNPVDSSTDGVIVAKLLDFVATGTTTVIRLLNINVLNNNFY